MVKLNDHEVGTTGYGLMGLTWRPEPTPTSSAISTMKTALQHGGTFWNGGEFYGTPDHNSGHILNAYFTQYPEDASKVIISIKGAAHPTKMTPQGDEAGIRRSVDTFLKLLDGKKKLDLFECARVDPETPIEESMRVLGEYVKEGKLGGISLSETGANSIRRAAKVTKIQAVEIEYSMFETEAITNGVMDACAELGIVVVAYSPLGRGFLTGQLKQISDLDKMPPMMKAFPRFQPGNFEKNLELVHKVEAVAKSKGCTLGQIALAWIRHQSGKNGMPEIIPIPGATTEARVLENLKEISLSDAEFEELQVIVKNATPAGERYPEHTAKYNWG